MTLTDPLPDNVRLDDGTLVTIRPIRPDDAPRLQAFHTRLSPESIYMRFLEAHPVLFDAEARRFTTVDYENRMALVATREEQDQELILGVARYDTFGPNRPDEAEMAIVVEDAYQGHGLGLALLDHLLAYARQHGVRIFVAEVSSENDRMLHFVQRSGLPTEKRLVDGTWELRVKIS